MELEHLKIETRLIDEKFANAMGEYVTGDLEVIGVPSKLNVIRRAAALARMLPTHVLGTEEKTARRKWKNPPLVDCAD